MDLKKNPKSYVGSSNFSAFDSFTNTLVIHNPIDSFIRFYNCSSEIEKFKSRITLLSRREDGEDFKDYKLIKSRNSVLSIIERNVNLKSEELDLLQVSINYHLFLIFQKTIEFIFF